MPTLYGVLGVEPDADEQSIRRAYRERAKRYHPDVNDSPDARATFKRLTTAKRVLTDETERTRYDRLGHEAYVRRALDGDAWTDGNGSSDTDSTADGDAINEAARRMASETASATTEPRASQRVDRRDGYATASEYYSPGQRVGVETQGPFSRLLGPVRGVLPWLLAHLALLGGALAAAAVLLSSTDGVPTAVTVIVATVMVGATAGVSALHLSATLFR